MKKRLLALLMCTVMVFTLVACSTGGIVDLDHDHDVPLADDPGEPTGAPASPTEAPNSGPCNHNWVTQSTTRTDDCIYGVTEVAYQVCTICGEHQDLAYRPEGAATGHHDYQVVARDDSCPEHPYIKEKCSKCGTIKETSGGHVWSAWTAVGGSCDNGEIRTCSYCHKTETQSASHRWVSQTSVPATCTEAEQITQRCSRCGQTRTLDGQPKLGHNFRSLPDCTVCGYQMKANAKPVQCQHDYQVTSKSSFSHIETCSKCGATISVNCSTSVSLSSRSDCTQTVYCKCGNVALQGYASHDLRGETIKDANGHSVACRHVGCQYKETAAHTYAASTSCTSPSKCTVCGYASGSAAYSDHAWGPWVNSGTGSHSRSCTHPGCTAKQSAAHSGGSGSGDCTTGITCKDCGAVVVAGSSDHAWGHWISSGGSHYRSCTHPGCSAKQSAAHSGGTATCASGALCKDCGAAYGAKDPANHSGGTEIRNAVAAKVGEKGYTGDTYCLGCGQKLADGQEIPELTNDHTHSYGAWFSDGARHWHECSCGDIKDTAAHTFKDGKCTVCGAADPTAEAEHVHTFTESWNADSQNHWHVCTVCGEKADVTAHVILENEDGSVQCLTCGLTLAEKTEKENTEAAVEQFSDIKETDYYSSAVGWAVKLGVTNGTNAAGTTFSPNAECTEKQILTMLYRAQRAAEDPDFQADSSDMEAALAWAFEYGLVSQDFDPDAVCTRSSAVTYMWKAAGSPAAGSANFSDVAGDADYAQAVAWAVEHAIVNGTGDGTTFSPAVECTRSQIVTLLHREAVGA